MKITQRSDRFQTGTGRPCTAASLLLALGGLLAACSSSSDSPSYPAPSAAVLATDDGAVTVSWTALPSASTYTLYWDSQPGLTKAASQRVEGIAGNQHTLTGLQNGDPYWFALAAVYAGGESVLSPEATVTLAPSAVSSITCTAEDSCVAISWDYVHGATSYNLYRSATPGVSKLNGSLIADVTSPHDDLLVVNGITYFYVLEAVGAGGPSPDSVQFSATPRFPLSAPRSLTVALVEETPNALQISWQPPAIGTPDSYNLYWGTSPGVTIGTNPILGVTSPFVHTGLPGQTTHYYIVTAVRDGFESDASAESAGTPHGSPGGGGGGGGGGDTGFGNNLSFPLVFADGYGLTGLPISGTVTPWLDFNTGLRPTSDQPLVSFPYYGPETARELNDILYYPQQTASTWQAEWRNGAQTRQEVVLDWGDNLTSATLHSSSGIRVEVTLYEDDPLDLLLAYDMALLSGSGHTELQGTSGNTVATSLRTVFALNARLRIEKLLGPGGSVDETVEPFSASVYESLGSDGPGGFSPEVNVAGKLTYGYVWRLRDMPLTQQQQLGWWRLTYSLDSESVLGELKLPGNVTIVGLDASETTATLDPEGNASSIEVEISQ